MLEQSIVERVLKAGLRTGGDFAEVFVEDVRSTAARLDDRKIEEVTSGRSRGAGVRVIVGETTGFAHTADLSEDGLLLAAEAAAAVARAPGPRDRIISLAGVSPGGASATEPVADGSARRGSGGGRPLVLPETVAKSAKVELLSRADDAARAGGSGIRQVTASYGDSRRRILVANSDGLLASDDQVRTRFSVVAVASGDTGLQTGRESHGYAMGFELFDDLDVEAAGRAAAGRALTKLTARPAPSGAMPVVIKSGGGGVLFHEACGHGLEADLVGKKASVFAGRQGEMVASPLVTLVDDGTMGPEWGAYVIDDEGHRAARNVLIADGVLTDYLYDFLRARKEGRAASTNGRRQSYRHLPMVRMTNTFLVNGTEDPDEIIRDTPHGVYVAQLGGGQVNTATGDFVFGMTEAYLIEAGRITEPLRDANLIGNGPQTLALIDVVGDDFAMGSPGTCGKDGQGVPVGDGQPTLRVRSMTIGGTAA